MPDLRNAQRNGANRGTLKLNCRDRVPKYIWHSAEILAELSIMSEARVKAGSCSSTVGWASGPSKTQTSV